MSLFARLLISVCAALVISAVLTPMLRNWAKRRGRLDVPNDASSHTVPTPRNGGIAIFTAFVLGSCTAWPLGEWKTIAVVTAAALLPLLDELMPISRSLRFLVQFGIAIGVVLLLKLDADHVALSSTMVVRLGVFGIVVAVIWLVAIMNAYNFMDGLNGLSSTAAVLCGASYAIVAVIHHDYGAAIVAATLSAAAAGFLPWNLPSGSVFMGDIGSTTIGLVLAILSLRLIRDGVPVLAAVIPLLSFCSDAFLTIVRRALRGERFFATRHRSHFYQWLNQQGWSHARVTGLWGLLIAASSAAAIYSATSSSAATLFAVAVAFVMHAMTFAWIALRQRSA